MINQYELNERNNIFYLIKKNDKFFFFLSISIFSIENNNCYIVQILYCN